MAREYRVGDWIVQPDLLRLRRGAEEFRIEPKVMQVLDLLAARPGEVLTRDELLAGAWPGTSVSDDALHRAVRELRRVFGDSASRSAYIETIRKRGYRLIAPVRPVAGGAPGSPGAGASASPPEPAAPARPHGRVAIRRDARRRLPFALVATGLGLTILVAVTVLTMRPVPAAADGSMRFVAMAAGPYNEVDPAPGPDGQLAYAMAQPSGSGGGALQSDLYLLDTPGGVPRRITTDPADDRMPVWRPDGEALAFVRFTAASCDIVTRVLASGVERRVAPCGNADEPRLAWSADGRWIVHSLAPEPAQARGWQIVRTAAETGVSEPLTLPPPGTVGDHSPAVASDGTVAFVRTIGGGVSDVYLVSIEGGAARRVTTDAGALEGVTWADEDRALVYSSDRAGGYTLWRVPVAGGEPELVAGGAAKLKHPRAAFGRVVYESWAYEINVWRVDLDRPDSPRAVVRTSDLWNYHPEPSPDGTRLAFVSTRSGAAEIWVADAGGGSPRQVTRFERAAIRAPRWSPDGARLVVPALAGGRADLYLVDVASGETRRITAGAGDEVAPAWSRDGSRIYFGTRRDGVWQVRAVDPGCTNASCESLVIERGFAAQESPDGQALYFTRADRAGLWRRALEGGEPALVLPFTPAGAWANWRVTANGIYFAASTAANAIALHHAGLDGTAIREVAPLAEMAWPGVALTPDGSAVLYARADRRESNILAIDTGR